MKLQTLFTDEDRAVSPVIGVILMVAITVILAAVIGSFVLGLGNSVQETAPNANFNFDFTEGADGDYNVTATHTGGDTIPSSDTLDLTSSSSFTYEGNNFSTPVSAGDDAQIGNVSTGATVRVIWTSANGQSSQALATDEAPS